MNASKLLFELFLFFELFSKLLKSFLNFFEVFSGFSQLFGPFSVVFRFSLSLSHHASHGCGLGVFVELWPAF